jgi:hypothetical protein
MNRDHPKLGGLQKRVATGKRKLEEAKAVGKPTPPASRRDLSKTRFTRLKMTFVWQVKHRPK